MTLSAEHKTLPISAIEQRISPAILFRRFRLFSKDKKPVAFLTWANVSDEVKARVEVGNIDIRPEEWNSGENIVVLDCIDPFGGRDEIIAEFMEQTKVIASPPSKEKHLEMKARFLPSFILAFLICNFGFAEQLDLEVPHKIISISNLWHGPFWIAPDRFVTHVVNGRKQGFLQLYGNPPIFSRVRFRERIAAYEAAIFFLGS